MPAERLRIVNGPLRGQALEVNGSLVLGRREQGLGNLGGDDELSRRHASLTRGPDGRIVVEDLGSTNGTLVNGAKIAGPTVLRPGDRLQVGMTHLDLVDEDRTQVDRDIPPAIAAQAQPLNPPPARAAAAPAAAAPPPLTPPVVPPTAPHTPFQPSPPPPPRRRRGGAVVLAVLGGLVLVAGAAAAVYFATKDDGGSGGGGASVPSDCGKSIGANGQQVAFVTYVESNIVKDGNKNSVIAIPYGAGDLKPLPMSRCATGGSGSADLTDSGVLDANGQIAVDRDKRVLFAVNQGSDTIAAYKIAANGGLEAVSGSPFPSGGKAPAALGISGDTLVVANKAQDGIRNLEAVAPNYTTFKIAPDGRLTQVNGSNVNAEPKSSPTDAYVPPEGGVAFSTEESGPLRGFAISSDGVLTQASNSPLDPDPAIFAEGFDDAKKFALGLVAHPTRDILYVSYPTVPALTVYTFDDTGFLRYESGLLNSGSYLPCWNVITPDGRFLYTSNADTNNVTVFDLANPLDPKQIQTLTFQTPGNPWNAAVDPGGKYLWVITPRDTLKVPEGEGNTIHTMSIGADGKLTEVQGSPAKLPVPSTANPQGLAVMPGPAAPS
jgi:DNA-binding beta-propeller fold protein YncE